MVDGQTENTPENTPENTVENTLTERTSLRMCSETYTKRSVASVELPPMIYDTCMYSIQFVFYSSHASNHHPSSVHHPNKREIVKCPELERRIHRETTINNKDTQGDDDKQQGVFFVATAGYMYRHNTTVYAHPPHLLTTRRKSKHSKKSLLLSGTH